LIQLIRTYNHLGFKWLSLSWGERLLLLEATIYLALARFLVSFVPFGRVAPFLGQHAATPPRYQTESCNQAQRVGLAVRTASHYAPWHSTCLMQAIAAKGMLQRRRLHSTLYLGVARTPDQQLEAHAWLQYGPRVLTGAQGRHRYTVVSTFTENHF
jgi:hypothetical protein